MNISLPDALKRFAESRTKSGFYSNTSDYVRDLIRRDEERLRKIAVMQEAVDEGLESGPAELFELSEFLDEVKAKRGEEA